MNKKQKEQHEAVERLKEWGLAPGTKVYGTVTHVSSSGMSRNIKLHIALNDEDGPRIVDISWLAARAIGWPYVDKYNGGIKVGGCGMNMILHTIDCLSYAMGYGNTNQNREAGDLPGLRGNY